MNKPAAVGSVLVLGLAAFVAGRYTTNLQSSPKSSANASFTTSTRCTPRIAPTNRVSLPTAAWRSNRVRGDDPSARLQLAPGAVASALKTADHRRPRGNRSPSPRACASFVPRPRRGDDNRVYRLTAVTDGRIQSLGDNPAAPWSRRIRFWPLSTAGNFAMRNKLIWAP